MKMRRIKKTSKLPNIDLFQPLYSLQEASLVPSYKTNRVQTSPLFFQTEMYKGKKTPVLQSVIVTAKML